MRPYVPLVREFFRRNPREWLTKPDMMVKFGLTEKQVDSAVEALIRDGTVYWEKVYGYAGDGTVPML